MIVMLTQCFPPVRGGIENVMGGLADALQEAGEALAVLADSSAASRATPDSFAYRVRRFGGLKWLRRQRKICAVKKLGAKAILADSWKSVQALPPQNIPVIVLAHGMEFPVRPSAAKAARIGKALAKATVVVANSRYTAGLVKPYVAAGTPIEIIHPPLVPQPSAGAMPEEYTGAALKLLSLSRLEPRKGIDHVIRAMPALLQLHPQAVFVVAGGGEDRARLEALAQELGVAQAVKFTGRVDAQRKADLLGHADIFAMPTRREGDSVEGFGLSYIEAAWYGVPALAGAEGGAPDAVLHEVTGLVCNGANAADVQTKLLQLAGDAALRQRLGKAAQTRAQNELQWNTALLRYQALMNGEGR